jgi:hypothetical protein
MSTRPPVSPGTPPGGAPGIPAGPAIPREKHNVLLWVLVGIGSVLIFGVVAILLIVHAVARTHVSVTTSGDSVVIQTPRGAISVNSGQPADLGLPIYPGALTLKDGGSVQFTANNDQRGGISGATYVTSDSLDKVEAWYRQRLGSAFEHDGPGPKSVIVRGMNVQIDGGEDAYISDSGDAVSIVGLKSRLGRVEIDLARIGRRTAQ